jgi:serine/threonine protein kinase
MDQLLNQVFHERYRLESLLERQTGRRTFLAHDLQTESRVVVKLLLFGPDFEWDDLKLFEREAAVLKSLDHPAIPHYLDAFDVETELGKGFALVQSYLEAPTLQAWIQSGRTFSELELKAIAQELLGVLDYLHSRSPAVVHRDLKPSNILLGDRSGNSPGQVYLVDFGSVQTAVHGGTRTVVGTYGYMPPEQFGGQTSPAVDLYALGATLIYLATGQHPDQLPQRELRILFADRTSSLSPPFTTWLQALTEPSLDLRLLSTQRALAQLENPEPGESSLATAPRPSGSKVKVTKKAKMFEIVIPSAGFNFFLKNSAPIVSTLYYIFFMSTTWGVISLAGGVNLAGAVIVLLAVYATYLFITKTLKNIFNIFCSMRVCITPSKISRYSNLLRVEYCSYSAVSENIVKLERPVEGPDQINIWVGTQKLSMGVAENLSPPEIDWLAEELSSWLNLPIT